MSTNPHVIVLAAGESSRLGEPKQLVRLDGRPLLHTVVSRAVALAGHAVTVVIGAHAQQLTPLLRHSPASVIVNRHWREGLGSSIRLGVSALPPACEAVMLLLADQVAVTADDLKRLASAWKGQDTVIAASLYSGTVGVPAIFPRWCFSDLMGLHGDRGAQMLLQRNVDRLVRVPMSNAAIDLDTPEQLAELRRSMQAPQAQEIRVRSNEDAQSAPVLNLNS